MAEERYVKVWKVWLAAITELYENAKELLVYLTFEKPLFIKPEDLQGNSVWSAEILYRLIELTPHLIDRNDELLFLRKFSSEKSTSPYPTDKDDTDKYLQFFGNVLDSKTETENQSKVHRTMKKVFGEKPMEAYKQCFATGKLTGYMKKLKDGTYKVDGIVETEQ